MTSLWKLLGSQRSVSAADANDEKPETTNVAAEEQNLSRDRGSTIVDFVCE